MRSSTRRTATLSSRCCWAVPAARPRTAPSPSTTRPRAAARAREPTTPPPAARSPSRRGRRPRPSSSRSPTTVPTSRRKASRSVSATRSTPRSPDGTGTVTIGASDAAAVSQPGISAPFDVAVGEGDGFVDLTVRLSAPEPEHGVGHATRLITEPRSPAPSAATAPTTSPRQGRSTSRPGRRRRSFAWRSSTVPISRIPRRSRSI